MQCEAPTTMVKCIIIIIEVTMGQADQANEKSPSLMNSMGTDLHAQRHLDNTTQCPGCLQRQESMRIPGWPACSHRMIPHDKELAHGSKLVLCNLFLAWQW